jgi:hypothetical protein
MEWVKPIDEVEAEFRRHGVFLLVDVSGRKLWFYGYKKDHTAIKRMIDSLRGRSKEMVKFLIARARVQRGETT